jgi:SnoaL-like domain
MMLKTGFLFITLLLSAIVFAQTVSKEKSAVQHTVENLFSALSNTDTAALKLYCASNVKFYEYGQIWTIDTMIHKVMQSKFIPDFKRTNSLEFVSTTINKTTAFTTYYLQSTFFRNGKEETVKWMETVVLLKEKKNWKVTVLHSTRLIKN